MEFLYMYGWCMDAILVLMGLLFLSLNRSYLLPLVLPLIGQCVGFFLNYVAIGATGMGSAGAASWPEVSVQGLQTNKYSPDAAVSCQTGPISEDSSRMVPQGPGAML